MDSNTPPPTSLGPSPPSAPSQRSGLDVMLSNSPGAAVSLFALAKLSPLLWLPFTDPRWRYVLALFGAICVPTLASVVLQLVREWLNKRQ